MFDANGKDECFKTCDACRVRGRAHKLKARVKQQESVEDAVPTPAPADDNVKDEINDSTNLTTYNLVQKKV